MTKPKAKATKVIDVAAVTTDGDYAWSGYSSNEIVEPTPQSAPDVPPSGEPDPLDNRAQAAAILTNLLPDADFILLYNDGQGMKRLTKPMTDERLLWWLEINKHALLKGILG